MLTEVMGPFGQARCALAAAEPRWDVIQCGVCRLRDALADIVARQTKAPTDNSIYHSNPHRIVYRPFSVVVVSCRRSGSCFPTGRLDIQYRRGQLLQQSN